MVGEIQDEVPVLMSGAGHDAMAMSHLTKVCIQLIYRLSLKLYSFAPASQRC